MEYYTYAELYPMVERKLRQELIDKGEKTGHRYLGDINKLHYGKKEVGEYLKKLGYKCKRMTIDKVRAIYYYKEDDLQQAD